MKISEMNTEQYVSLCERITEFVRTFPPEDGHTVFGLPTIRMVAKRFGVPQKEIIIICEDTDTLDYNVGIQTHSGHGVFPTVGDYLVEYTGEIE